MDDFCRARGIERVDLIKIDVEGYEQRVLAGARQTLLKYRPTLLVEVNPHTLARTDASAVGLLNMIRSAGYELFVPKRRTLQPLTALPAADEYINVLARPVP